MAPGPGPGRKRRKPDTAESHSEPSSIGPRTRGVAKAQRHKAFGKLLAIPELLSLLMSYLPTADLSHLCRTSKSLYALARPFLYETVLLEGKNLGSISSLLGNSGLVHTREISAYSNCWTPDQYINHMKILATIPNLKCYRWIDAPSCLVYTKSRLEQLSASLDHLAIAYRPLVYRSAIVYNDRVLNIPSFVVAKNWNLTSLVLVNMPPYLEGWGKSLEQVLLSSPNLSTLSLGFYSPHRWAIGARSEEFVWTQGHITGFLGTLCRAYARSNGRVLSLRKLHLFNGFSVCGSTCENTTQNLQDLQQLVDLSFVDDLHLWNDPVMVEYQPANVATSLGILTLGVMPRLRRLSFSRWDDLVTAWLRCSDPSFVQQLSLISDDGREPWLKLLGLGAPRNIPCPRMLGLESYGYQTRMYEAYPSFMEAMSMLEGRCNLVSGLWFRVPMHGVDDDDDDPIPLLVDRLRQMPNLEELVLDLPGHLTRFPKGAVSDPVKIASRIIQGRTTSLKYLAFARSSIYPARIFDDVPITKHCQAKSTFLRRGVWRISEGDEGGISTPVLMKMEETEIWSVELFRATQPVFPDLTPCNVPMSGYMTISGPERF